MLSDSGIYIPDFADCVCKQWRMGTGGGVFGSDTAIVVCAVIRREEFAGICELP